jgi:hypothetical protein
VAGVRGDDDYVPASPPEHPGKHRPYAVERPFAVNLDGASPLLLAQILHEHGVSKLHNNLISGSMLNSPTASQSAIRAGDVTRIVSL